MAEIASRRQLRVAWLRWAMVVVPATLLAGMVSGRLANSGYGNIWFDQLDKPPLMPPGWVFPVAWSILYILTGLALSFILSARRAPGRGLAIGTFLIQLALNLAWSPVFFAQHRIMLAFGLILFILLWASVATWLFWRIRTIAGALMLPYLAWLLFAALLNWQIHEYNPDGGRLAPAGQATQITIE